MGGKAPVVPRGTELSRAIHDARKPAVSSHVDWKRCQGDKPHCFRVPRRKRKVTLAEKA